MTTDFPSLSPPPRAIVDSGKVRLGDGCITAEFPPRQFSRRGFLRTTALVPAVIAAAMLDGCSALTTAVALAPQIAQYAGVIANAITLVLPSIQTLTGLAGGALHTVEWFIGDVQATASRIATATATTASSLITTLGSDLGGIAGKLSGVAGLPTLVDDIISNALAAYTGIETMFFGAPTVTPPPVAAMHRFAARAATIRPDQAIANLQAILARHG